MAVVMRQLHMTENTMGTDLVTGKQVVSEGLLQLSYQGVPNYGATLKYPLCRIEWSKDKNLAATDSKKTILDPLINLEYPHPQVASAVAIKLLKNLLHYRQDQKNR
ncbi:MAG: hypothetical protein AAGB31_03715 [Bdellovibrio sp.]